MAGNIFLQQSPSGKCATYFLCYSFQLCLPFSFQPKVAIPYRDLAGILESKDMKAKQIGVILEMQGHTKFSKLGICSWYWYWQAYRWLASFIYYPTSFLNGFDTDYWEITHLHTILSHYCSSPKTEWCKSFWYEGGNARNSIKLSILFFFILFSFPSFFCLPLSLLPQILSLPTASFVKNITLAGSQKGQQHKRQAFNDSRDAYLSPGAMLGHEKGLGWMEQGSEMLKPKVQGHEICKTD